jgi:hypothetical protein
MSNEHQQAIISTLDALVTSLKKELNASQAEIERLIGAEPITYGMLTVCKNCGQQNPYFEKAQEK